MPNHHRGYQTHILSSDSHTLSLRVTNFPHDGSADLMRFLYVYQVHHGTVYITKLISQLHIY